MAKNVSDFLNLPKSKPGSSTAYGESLLAGKIKRSEKRAESAEQFDKFLIAAKGLTAGAKWWMEEDIENFHRGNSTVYANLESLITANKQIIADQQAIVNSKMSAVDYYTKQYYDSFVADAINAGKVINYGLLKNEANKIGMQSAARQQKLYEKAKHMPTTLQDYKDAAANYYDKPENIFEKGLELGRKALGRMDPEVLKLREGKLTLQKLAAYENQGMFDAAMGFKTALESQDVSYQSAAIDIIDNLKSKPKQIDTHYEESTDTRKEIVDVTGKTIPNPNFNQKMLTKIVEITGEDGSSLSSSVEQIPLHELDTFELLTDNFQATVIKSLSPSGQAWVNKELKKLDPAEKTKAGSGTIKGALDWLTENRDQTQYYAIIDQALAVPEYRIMDAESTTVNDILLRSALSAFNDITKNIAWDWTDPEQRSHAARLYKEIITGNKFIAQVITKTVGDTTITQQSLSEKINKMDNDAIIKYVLDLQAFGEESAIRLAAPFTD